MGKSKELPEDIIFKILLYLPAKLLIRLSLVCKSWRNLITSDESFARSHLNRVTADNNCHVELLMFSHAEVSYDVCRYSNNLLPTDDDGHDDLVEKSRRLPKILHLRYDFFVAGCCDGLICFYKVYSRHIYVWNPVLRQCITFQTMEDSKRRSIEASDCVGFCFDPQNKDYKVVRLVCFKLATVEFEFYSLKNSSWKSIICSFPGPMGSCRRGSINSSLDFNGFLHWIGGPTFHYWNEIKGKEYFILASDIVDEKLKLVPMPSSTHDYGIYNVCFGVLNGCFSVITSVDRSRCEIWSMRAYGVADSWVKYAAIPFLSGHPIGINASGKILFREGHIVFAYDCVERERLDTLKPTFGSEKKYDHCVLAKYVESLISIPSAEKSSSNDLSFILV